MNAPDRHGQPHAVPRRGGTTDATHPGTPPRSEGTIEPPQTKTRMVPLLALVLAFPAVGQELIWNTLSLAGVAELKDGKPAEGFVFAAQKLLEQATPELNHRYIISSPNRLTHEMASGVPRCSTLTVRHPERDRAGYFVPYLPALPMQLVVRAEMRDQLPIEHGLLSLERLLERRDLQGAIVTTRGYPPDLHALLNRGLVEGRIRAINSNSSGSNLLSMVSYKRLDYSLEFGIVLKRYAEATALPHPLLTLPIAESTHLSPAGLYCTQNPWGKAMALRLDQAVRQIVASPEQLIPLYRTTFDTQALDDFEPQLRAYLESRARTPTEF